MSWRTTTTGFAPSLRFGIATATKVTLNALLTHYHDQPDYGLPPVNGAPAAVDRKKFDRATDDRTVQDVVSLNATGRSPARRGRRMSNQTQYSRYRIDARESGPNGCRHALGRRCLHGLSGNEPGERNNLALDVLSSGSGATTASSPIRRSTTGPT